VPGRKTERIPWVIHFRGPERSAGLGVEPGGRLVEEDELGPADDAERDVESPSLPARQRPRAPSGRLCQAHRFDHLVGISGGRVVAGEVRDHLPHGQLGVLRRCLEDDADPGAPLAASLVRVDPQHRHLAGVLAAVALEDLHRRRLACAVGAEQREDLTGVNVQIDPVDRGEAAIALGQAADSHRVDARHVSRLPADTRRRQHRRSTALRMQHVVCLSQRFTRLAPVPM